MGVRWIVGVLALGCGKDPERPPAPEPTTPAPVPEPQPVTGPPTSTDNADTYDFGLGESAEMFAAAAGTYAVTCVGASPGGFLGGAYLIVGPGMTLAVLRADGSTFIDVEADGLGDFADRTTDATGAVSWTLKVQGEGPDSLQNYDFSFSDTGEIGATALDPLSGSLHCVDYNTTFTLAAGTSPPAVLNALDGPAVRLLGGTEDVDVTVAAGTVTLDRPPFDGTPDFVYTWTGGGELAVVDLDAGDWSVTDSAGVSTITIQAVGGVGNGGITLTADGSGLLGVVTDQLVAGD